MLRLVFPSDPGVPGSPAAPGLSRTERLKEGSGFGGRMTLPRWTPEHGM